MDINKKLEDTLEALHNGYLIEFVLEINRSIGLIFSEDTYKVLGAEDMDCRTPDEVKVFISKERLNRCNNKSLEKTRLFLYLKAD